MLVLTLTEGEGVWLGERADIRVTLVRIDGYQVRLGFEAPTDVPILRQQLAAEQLAYYGRLLVPFEAAQMLRERGRADG